MANINDSNSCDSIYSAESDSDTESRHKPGSQPVVDHSDTESRSQPGSQSLAENHPQTQLSPVSQSESQGSAAENQPTEQPSTSGSESKSSLPEDVKDIIERKRQQALMLRAAKRPAVEPPPKVPVKLVPVVPTKVNRVEPPKKRVIDTDGGFLLEETTSTAEKPNIVHEPGGLLDDSDRVMCEECCREFLDSYLMNKFNKSVCDSCKDLQGKHKLITKTDAKTKYQLKDADLDQREPPLMFVVRKNPRHEKWGEMKLYLESQVEARAFEVLGGEDGIEKAKQKKAERREKIQQKKFDKNVQALRMALQSTQPTKSHKTHKHEFGVEVYNSATDQFTKTCKLCGHSMSYEKM